MDNLDNKDENLDNKDEKKDEKVPTVYSQSELDKKINDALVTRERNLQKVFDETLQAKIAESLKENTRLGSLSEKEKNDESYASRLADLDKRELSIKNSTLKNDMRVELAKLNLDESSLELLIRDSDTSPEDALLRLNSLVKAVEKASQATLEKKMKDSSYVPSGGKTSEVTLDTYNKMSYTERAKLKDTNLALYNKLSTEFRESL